MYRAKESLLPIQYYNRLPKGQTCDVAYIVDPCIATANTVNAVVSILKRWGAKKIVVIATIGSRLGVNRLLELHPTVEIYIGAIDETISETGMIVPGIGDAGDRQFGTVDEIPDFLPVAPAAGSPSPSKRKHEAVSGSK
jgi:uracil phosphoribosyltransferase